MGQAKLKVNLFRHTANPEELVSIGAKLCYSKSNMDELEKGIQYKDQTGFIKQLTGMGHMSPVEHVNFTFGIEGVSRALLAQITRHRIASFSVQSQRYVGEKGESFEYIMPPAIEALGEEYVAKYESQMDTIQKWYNEWCDALGGEGEKTFEDARFVLPNACETKMLVTMNARELMHFFNLRCCRRAQWEIRELAYHMLALCKRVAPVLFSASGPGCVSGGCTEGRMSCGRPKEVKELADDITEAAAASRLDDQKLFSRVDELLKEHD